MQGHLNLPLNETGRKQARALAQRLAAWPITTIYSSDLARCAETAVILGNTLNLEPIYQTIWRERDLGVLSGLTRQEAREKYPHAVHKKSFTEIVPPDGETHAMLQIRGREAFEQVIANHTDEMIAVVTHGGLLHVLMAHLIGLPDNEYGRFTMRGNTGLSIVELHEQNKLVIACLNDTSHLEQQPELA